MPLPAGSRIGVYQVLSLIGRGGMGEVYRAHDCRLGRDVALKTLPHPLATDQEFVSRFEREARILASLSHPNIAGIHGIEDATSGDAPQKALVMELVEGETLDERLDKGPLPLDTAIELARQIADALNAAHQIGVVHRDLKPANIKITPAGVVKVLDFGLAKSMAPVPQDGVTVSVTAQAVLVGTPGYMAPEQVQGRSADTRADIWAFGVVLYEMLTGERLFRGDTMQATLAAVLTTEPPWSRVPSRAQRLLRACLERDPRRRLSDIADWHFLLDGASEAPAQARRGRARTWLSAAGGVAAIALGFIAGRTSSSNDLPAAATVRLSTLLPPGVSVTRGPGYTSSVAVSPDGRTLVIAGSDKDGQRLYYRPLDRLDPSPLAGGERGSSPFFSWDGAWVGFFADGRLKRVPVAGGAAVEIADAPGHPAGGSWGPDDTIIFAFGADSLLHMVSAQGGPVTPLAHGSDARHPELMPDGRTVLYERNGRVHALNRQTGETHELAAGRAPRYARGHLILSRGTTLLAAPLDRHTYQLTGTVFPIAEHVAVELPGSSGGRHYSMSRGGTLAFVPAAEAYELVLLNASGAERVIAAQQPSFENPRFSPDGERVVVAARRREEEPANLWMHDLRTDTATQLTFDGGRAPVWTPDGARITYSHLGDNPGIYARRVDGVGEPSRLVPLGAFHWLVGWADYPQSVVYGVMDRARSSIVATAGGQQRTVVGPGSTWGGRLSKDGRWLAYYLLEEGLFKIYVRPLEEGNARWLIAEGTDPAWAPAGDEIFYRSGPRLMAARIDKSSGVRVLSHRVVVDPFLPPLYDDYDIHPDGHTLVIVRPAKQSQGREVTVVINAIREPRQGP